MKYLLDTNSVIYLIHKKEPFSSKILKKRPEDFYVSGFTEAELRYAIERSPEVYRLQNELAISIFLSSFERVYHNENVSQEYGKIKAYLKNKNYYEPRNEIDILIAATAIAYDLTLITANIKDFKKIQNLKIVDWT